VCNHDKLVVNRLQLLLHCDFDIGIQSESGPQKLRSWYVLVQVSTPHIADVMIARHV